MATRLKISSETNYKDLDFNSPTEEKTCIESYVEGEEDILTWRLEQFCKFLLADGFYINNIQQYINYDGSEVFKIDEE